MTSPIEDLLYEHRQGALTCYNHDHAGYCCVCGEHDQKSFHAHLAAVLQEHFATDEARLKELVKEAVVEVMREANERAVFAWGNQHHIVQPPIPFPHIGR